MDIHIHTISIIYYLYRDSIKNSATIQSIRLNDEIGCFNTRFFSPFIILKLNILFSPKYLMYKY